MIPAWWNTPAEAKRSIIQITVACCSATAVMISDLVTNPLKRGKAEIEAAPTQQKTVVHGIVFQRPPSSEPLTVPTRKRTAPIAMKRSPSKRMLAKACAAAPFSASPVPMPIPTTMKPSWLFRL